MLASHDRRQIVVELLRVAKSPKILVPLFVAAAYATGLVLAGRRLGLWAKTLSFDTALWFLGTAIALMFSLADAARNEHFFRRTALRTLKATALVEVFVNFRVFGLAVELALVPLISFVALLALVAGMKKETLVVKRVCDALLALAGFVLLGLTTAYLIHDWSIIDKSLLWQSLALPVWLTVAYLPFVYLLTLYSGYEMAFLRLNLLARKGAGNAKRAKLALVCGLHCHYSLVNHFGGVWIERVLDADSLRAARQAVREYRHSRIDDLRAEREKQRRLRRFAGADGEDEHGRRLDQREFDATRNGLMTLATAQMGLFHQLSRYRPDLLEMFTPNLLSDGLPADHGISLLVSADGKAWYAWRCTITGWCFAVGACAPPPDQWLFDGAVPPKGFPGDDASWGRRWGQDAKNW
jgi:hypothetical protein